MYWYFENRKFYSAFQCATMKSIFLQVIQVIPMNLQIKTKKVIKQFSIKATLKCFMMLKPSCQIRKKLSCIFEEK